MARRSKDGAGSVLLGLLALVVIAMAVVGPFVIAGWALFNEMRSRRRFSNGTADSLVTPEERAALDKADVALRGIEARIDRVFARGSELYRRADGFFDERSYKGRDLNAELNHLFGQKISVEADKAALADRIGGRIGRWLTAKSQLFGARAALLTYVSVFCAVGLGSASSAATSPNIFAFTDPASDSARVAASLGATVTAVIVMIIATLIRRSSLKQTF